MPKIGLIHGTFGEKRQVPASKAHWQGGQFENTSEQNIDQGLGKRW